MPKCSLTAAFLAFMAFLCAGRRGERIDHDVRSYWYGILQSGSGDASRGRDARAARPTLQAQSRYRTPRACNAWHALKRNRTFRMNTNTFNLRC